MWQQQGGPAPYGGGPPPNQPPPFDGGYGGYYPYGGAPPPPPQQFPPQGPPQPGWEAQDPYYFYYQQQQQQQPPYPPPDQFQQPPPPHFHQQQQGWDPSGYYYPPQQPQGPPGHFPPPLPPENFPPMPPPHQQPPFNNPYDYPHHPNEGAFPPPLPPEPHHPHHYHHQGPPPNGPPPLPPEMAPHPPHLHPRPPPPTRHSPQKPALQQQAIPKVLEKLRMVQCRVDATDVFLPPGRKMRPEKLCVILRGLPGSGKTHLARMIRDIEKENGGSVRILSLDDYFLVETTKEQKDEHGKTQKVVSMEYVHDPEMEPTYMASHFRSFKKTLEEGRFPVVVVDSINIMQGHFKEFWDAAKAKGFEVYVAELNNDVKRCAERNKHGWNLLSLERMVQDWERTPEYMTILDPKKLMGEKAIEEVEMEEGEEEEPSIHHNPATTGGGSLSTTPQGKGTEGGRVGSGGLSSHGKEVDGEGEGDKRKREDEEEEEGKSKKSRGRWDSDDEDEEAEEEKAKQEATSKAASQSPQPRRSLQWKVPLYERAWFDEGDAVGVIHRDLWGGKEGGFELGLLATFREQEKRKQAESFAKGGHGPQERPVESPAKAQEHHLAFLQKMHEEQRSFREILMKRKQQRWADDDDDDEDDED